MASQPGVLVVGAGPTGLTLALTLRKNGVPVRIIDRQADFPLVQRGSGIMPRTLEVFHYLGVLPDVQALYRPLQPENHYKPGSMTAEKTTHMHQPIDPTPDVPYPNPVLLGQGFTQKILREHLGRLGTTVETETELREFNQDPEGVTATLVKHRGDEESTETVRLNYLVGTDGGRSIIRKSLGLSFEGKALDQGVILGELELEGLDTNHWHRWSDWQNPTMVTVMFRPTEIPGQFFFLAGGHVDYSALVADHEKLLAAMRDFVGRPEIKLGKILYATEYLPHARVADKFSVGRVFIAGDAGHVHGPQGGQGLNTSVQDAFNLGWKLALVERHIAAPSLLDTYTLERQPIAKRMVQETLGIYKDVVAAIATGTETHKARAAHLKQLGINYRWSPLVRDERQPVDKQQTLDELDVYGVRGGDVLRAGDRAPDATGLVEVVEGGGRTTRLFDVLQVTNHTVLVFTSDPEKARPVIEAVGTLPRDAVAAAVVYPQGASAVPPATDVYRVFADGEGHAYRFLGAPANETTVFIVRPDGVIGGIVFGEEGVTKYFEGIFSAA